MPGARLASLRRFARFGADRPAGDLEQLRCDELERLEALLGTAEDDRALGRGDDRCPRRVVVRPSRPAPRIPRGGLATSRKIVGGVI